MTLLHVLAVEAEPDDRNAIEAAFGRFGCKVVTVRNAKAALTAVAIRQFDLICLDPRDRWSDDVLARLGADQYAVAWFTGPRELAPRFDGVLARPLIPIAAAVTVAMAKMAALRSQGLAPKQESAAA